MRPNSIRYFEWITLAAYALGVFRLQADWPQIATNSAVLSPSHPGLSAILVFGVGLLVGFGLVLLISRWGSRIAMWIYIVMTVCGLPPVLRDLFQSEMSVESAIIIVQTVAEIGAIALLFDPRAKAWMRRKRKPQITVSTSAT